MKYGFFDESKKEYVITRPDTPAPWVNYLGSPEYGAIISNNAGGYSFAKSGANGRILRYIFNQFDQPGRYIYLRDQESEDYWSASWQPVGKDLNSYKSECHHGTAYTKIRRLEPYCYGQFTEGKHSPNFGRSHVHWLTGTASTVMVGCVEGILGMRPDFYGLKIAPSVPKEWEEFEIEKDFRGSHLHIVVKNPGHAESGCEKLFVNGEQMKDNYIPQEKLTKTTEVELFLS